MRTMDAYRSSGPHDWGDEVAPKAEDPPFNSTDAGVVSGWLVALDIDDTLTGSGRPDVPSETASAVRAARVAGHEIVIATGRSLAGAMTIAHALGQTGWVIASNGAITVRMDAQSPDGYSLEDANTLDVSPVVCLALALAPDLRVAVEDIGWGYLVNRPFEQGQLNGRQRCVGEPADLWERPAPRVVLAGAEIVDTLLEPLHDLGVTANPNGPDWIDVTPAGLSKASALEGMRALLRIPRERTVAIGDGVNDIEALRWAARGVAMGQAGEEVRAAADETTGTIDEHGVIAVLRSLPTPRRLAEATAAG